MSNYLLDPGPCVRFEPGFGYVVKIGDELIGTFRIGERHEPDEGCGVVSGARLVTVGGVLVGQIRVGQEIGVSAEPDRLAFVSATCEDH